MPDSIVVLSKKFEIQYTTDMNKDEYGETDLELKIIKINANKAKHTWRSTLLHEIIHAILGICGQGTRMESNEEEGVVIALEHGLEGLVDFIDF